MYYASLLLAVCSVAFANPHPAVTLARRQRDFLTEAVTVTVGGTSASTFTHTVSFYARPFCHDAISRFCCLASNYFWSLYLRLSHNSELSGEKTLTPKPLEDPSRHPN